MNPYKKIDFRKIEPISKIHDIIKTDDDKDKVESKDKKNSKFARMLKAELNKEKQK